MGVLVVHCPNRPKDEIIDCGVYGLWQNMRSHNVDAINGEVVAGVPVPAGKKFPSAEAEDDKIVAAKKAARSQSVGAVVGTEPSGILSTSLPGGVIMEEPPPAPAKPTNDKPAQAKSGGE